MIDKDFLILVVDDDEIERQSIQRAFKKNAMDDRLLFAVDGYEALGRLTGDYGYERFEKLPSVILLDINMPRLNGFEFLEQLGTYEEILIPHIYILTTSDNEQDIKQAYKMKTSGFIVKPENGQLFSEMIATLIATWQIKSFPPRF